MRALIACPFCGNTKVTINTKAKSYFIKKAAEREKKDTSNYTCRCTRCGSKGPLKHSQDEASEAWSIRFQDDCWSPIDTAPKDGTAVLIWKADERRVGEYMMAAFWSDDQEGFVPVGGAHKQGYYSEWAGANQGYPTHWMPLPNPPPSKAQKDRADE